MHANAVPESFLSKVLQRLVGAGVLVSRRGGHGGFALALAAEQITALRVVEAIDGPILLNRCIPGDVGCDRSNQCAVHPLWLEAQTALVKVLAERTMAELGNRQRSLNLRTGTATPP